MPRVPAPHVAIKVNLAPARIWGDNMSSRFDAYVLGNTSTEYQRLRMQALAWEEATRRALAKAGVEPGANCLDVGSGPGEVMRVLRELVGPQGHVTGVDKDGVIGAQALTALTAVYGSNVAFHQVDVATDAAIPNAPFDMVFGRFVLFHQRDQIAMLRKLWDVTKPGGTLLIMDADVMAPFSAWPAWAVEIRNFFQSTLTSAGLDLETGRRMPERFVTSGIGEPDGLDASTLMFKAPQVAAFAVTVANSLLPAALQMQTITQEKFDAMVAATTAGAASDPSWLYWPLVVATWKKKPG